MKKFGLNTILIGVLSFLVGWLGWWEWSFAIVAFAVAFFVNDGSGKSYLAAFTVVGTIWFFVANSMIIANEGRLATMVADLFMRLSSTQLLYATSMIGALVAGFSAMTGSLARDAFLPKRNRKGERI